MPQAQPRYVALPNGSYLEWPEGVTADQFKAKALKVMGQVTPSTPVRRDTKVDLMFPEGGTVSAYHPRTGFAGIEDQLTSLKNRISSHLDRGVGKGAGDYIPFVNMPGGILEVLRGITKGAQGEPWQATKDIVGGGMQAASGPLSFMAPESGAAKSSIGLESATRSLTDAINPPVKQMTRFEKSLGEQLDKIITFASQKGINLDSVEGVAKAMKEAATSIREHYYDKILAPFKDVQADSTGVTLGQLDNRLSRINAELFPKYAKGGQAARTSVMSEAELNAEAKDTRNLLYSKLGQVTGLGEETIAKMRQSFGALEDLYERTQESAVSARHAANVAAREPLTLNPLSNSKQFLADKALAKFQGNPVQKAIREAMSRADIPRYELPSPNPAVAAKSVRSAPIRGVGKAIGEIAEPSAEERAAVGSKVASRARANAERNALAKKKAELEKVQEELRKMKHPFWGEGPS